MTERALSEMDIEAIAEATTRKLVEIAGEQFKTFGLVDARELAEGLGEIAGISARTVRNVLGHRSDERRAVRR